MTTGLINEIRALRDKATDRDDWEFLGAILAADEASKAAEQLTDETRHCSVCGSTWPASLLSEDGRCPDCVLIWMHEHFTRRRAARLMEGW